MTARPVDQGVAVFIQPRLLGRIQNSLNEATRMEGYDGHAMNNSNIRLAKMI